MPAQSEEYKFAIQIEKYTDRIGMNYGHTVMRCMTRNSSIQANMFDLVTSFLNGWANAYETGYVKPEHKSYRMCEMSYRMLQVMRAPEVSEPASTGRHRSAEDE